uniref:NADH-ubiquinone oxidoreductase chain 5 n=1 Tax=Uroctonus mordax TaxID=507508 RepID=B2CKX7_9SCOR|nr:NADH dehydrogenase subunit 5 [Uroctonus mordax]ACA62676.1 NADH dehydrogenase subunit 5 [Uroctonus mordax]
MINLYKTWSKLLLLTSMILMILGMLMIKKEWALILQFNFIEIKSCKMEMFIIFDWISMIFSSAVLFISSMVIMFSEEYMEMDNFKNRFLLMVLLFVLSMFLLILSPNMMSILLGWDGLGLVSYCLVIYYQNPRSYNAGMLTVLSNRIGDVFLLMSISLLISFGTWDIIILNNSKMSWIILLLIMMAAMTKSAQIPFSAWLPAAMAAPTPVSALVHSSTLVTAGVFLLIRFHNIFNNNLISSILLISSCLTMLMAGIGATLETDMKKIIALSTLSQLGVMMMALSMNLWLLAYFHMITHAMFKALLFLCAGYIIHNTKNNQDIRKMGMLIFPSPLISSAMLTSSLALMGFPFLAGFYSKDLILEQSMKSFFFMFSMVLTLISFGMTMAYSVRMPFLSMISKSKTSKSMLMEETQKMKNSIFSLAMMAITTGAMLSWMILPSPPTITIHTFSKMMGVILISIGVIISSTLWLMNINLNSMKMLKNTFLGSMWFLPLMSTFMFTKMMMKINIIKPSEMGWNEMMGAQGIYKNIFIQSSMISKLQNNEIQLFMFSFILIIIMLLYI